MANKITKSQKEWEALLSTEDYYICRQKGTERAFTGIYHDCHLSGVYRCKCCNAPLFTSDTKFDSRSGWPSFFAPTSKEAIRYEVDTSHGMRRVEIMCARCDCHLGHVFPDGPEPTGERYCVNSASISLEQLE